MIILCKDELDISSAKGRLSRFESQPGGQRDSWKLQVRELLNSVDIDWPAKRMKIPPLQTLKAASRCSDTIVLGPQNCLLRLQPYLLQLSLLPKVFRASSSNRSIGTCVVHCIVFYLNTQASLSTSHSTIKQQPARWIFRVSYFNSIQQSEIDLLGVVTSWTSAKKYRVKREELSPD